MVTTEDKVVRYRQQLHDSFEFFLKEVWRLDRSFVPSRIQLDFARWIAYGPDRCGAIGFRGMAKTWITCAACLWWLYRDKEEKILLVCVNEAYAKASLTMIRGWMNAMPFLRHLLPGKDQRDNTEELDVAGCKTDRIASLRALGISGSLPGGRASKIILDDAEQPENTTTRQQRETLYRRVGEIEPILVPCTPGMITRPAIRILGTYQHVESVYDKLQKVAADRQHKPYIFRNWPIQYPKPEETTIILAPLFRKDLENGHAKPGDPVWPERFGREYIYSLPMGRTRFLQQFMGYQDTSNLARYPLRLRDLIVYPVNKIMAPMAIQWGRSNNKGDLAIEDIPSCGFGDDCFYGPCMVSDQWAPYVGCKAFLDPAGRGEDESAYAVVGQLHGYLFVKRVIGFSGGPTEENLDRLAQDLREDHCRELYVEDTFGGDALIRLIESTIAKFALAPDPKNTEYPEGWSCAVIPFHAQGRGAKEVWICDRLEAAMSHHRLVFDPDVARNQTLCAQLVNMTRERACQEHEDEVEALAGAVAQFADALGVSPERQREDERKRREEARLAQYCAKHKINLPVKTWSGLDPNGYGRM
jgi:hypothetical protein